MLDDKRLPNNCVIIVLIIIMIREGFSFYIPTKNNGIVLKRNYNRTDEPIKNDDVIGLYELNLSDYLLETIILFIVKRIRQCENNKKIKFLYSLIHRADLLANKIHTKEIGLFENESRDDNFLYESREEIIDESYSIAALCIEERIFDYE